MKEIEKINLLGMTLEQLKSWFSDKGEPAFRAAQVFKWVHQAGVSDFSQMTNLSKKLRETLIQEAEVRAPDVVMEQPSDDGTRKWLFKLDDEQCIEVVFIPEKTRGTLCVSSQVGCALDCTFCSTARQGFNRNLTASEIIGQVWAARNQLGFPEVERPITNVVMMGMGEPLLNYENAISAMTIMLDDNAYGMSRRRVTLSTSGVVPALKRMGHDIEVALAVSLHAPTNELRDKLVPLNKKYPIEMLMEACHEYLECRGSREKVTFEYVLLEGVNDQPEHAHQLARLTKKIPSKVNLIPFNPFPSTIYARSGESAINRFQKILMDKGVNTMRRKTRGDDIDAACGQLAGEVNDRSGRELRFAKMNLTEGR